MPVRSAQTPFSGRDKNQSKASSKLSYKASSLGAYEHVTTEAAGHLTTPAESESSVIVVTSCNGLTIIEYIQTDKPMNRVSHL